MFYIKLYTYIHIRNTLASMKIYKIEETKRTVLFIFSLFFIKLEFSVYSQSQCLVAVIPSRYHIIHHNNIISYSLPYLFILKQIHEHNSAKYKFLFIFGISCARMYVVQIYKREIDHHLPQSEHTYDSESRDRKHSMHKQQKILKGILTNG